MVISRAQNPSIFRRRFPIRLWYRNQRLTRKNPLPGIQFGPQRRFPKVRKRARIGCNLGSRVKRGGEELGRTPNDLAGAFQALADQRRDAAIVLQTSMLLRSAENHGAGSSDAGAEGAARLAHGVAWPQRTNVWRTATKRAPRTKRPTSVCTPVTPTTP